MADTYVACANVESVLTGAASSLLENVTCNHQNQFSLS